MTKSIILTLCFLLSITSLSARSRQLPLDTARALQSAVISYKMVDLETGAVVASRNSSQCATPASITKIITTATALELLGPGFTFDTRIETDGILLDDGTLEGNIIIRGGADPTLGSIFLGDRNFISHFAIQIQRYGIRRITGNIVATASCLDHCPVPLKWSWEDIGAHYGAGAFGLSAFDNTSIITLRSGATGSKPEVLSIWPEMPNMRTFNEIIVPIIPKDSIVVFNAPYSHQRILQGCISPNRNNQVVKASISNPPLLVADYLYNELRGRGITIDGSAIVDDTTRFASTDTIYTNHSRRLEEVIRLTNYKSNNLYAELTFRRLGCINGMTGATTGMATTMVKTFWTGAGLDCNSLFLYDGCGLAPQNAFSADFLTDVLIYMDKSRYRDQFYNSLPTAGKEGTVAGFLRNTPLEGRARIKSGSISGVQCFSGYITAASGHRYAFTIMMNNYSCSRRDIRKIMEHWLTRDAK